ncbi:methyl-CpG-binding domain protein 2-like isoform X2 [Lates japonicus]|uniref:Methyl-CpG-binding domain protein 2-like isoform X2 n=1 Tax=Lates japonicus TaxID=270547 RepID=A0AAD3NFL6_LATJO|nr:methyl-CpG-binding domain protein 2-like isoform X2 [Lates japonicus]
MVMPEDELFLGEKRLKGLRSSERHRGSPETMDLPKDYPECWSRLSDDTLLSAIIQRLPAGSSPITGQASVTAEKNPRPSGWCVQPLCGVHVTDEHPVKPVSSSQQEELLTVTAETTSTFS